MKNRPERFTDNIVDLQNKIEKARQEIEVAEEIMGKSTDEKEKNKLNQLNKQKTQAINQMRGEIIGAIDSRARDSR